MIKVYVNAYKAEQKLKRLRQQIDKASSISGKQIGELGKNYARSIAPVNTGKLISLIKLYRGKNKNQWIIRSLNPLANDGDSRGRYGGPVPFNLVQWMHLTMGKWKSGPLAGKKANFSGKSPIYMYKTREYLQRVAKARAKSTFKEVIINK